MDIFDEKKGLFARILDSKNIYNSIYCLESYISEKGLLKEADLEDLERLKDKFDYKLIREYISNCQSRLQSILEDPNVLFDIEVYFKIKKFKESSNGQNEGEIKFRPIHTASLIDQICMVSMLLPLVYDDTSGKRQYSDLTKLIPHDFYGNIIGTKMESLFKPWISQYKSYTENIIDHCKEYRENRRYKTEVSLDIENFFPSISPEFIFNYISNKLQFLYKDKAQQKELQTVLSKLLIFNIKPENLDGWQKSYYEESVPLQPHNYFNRGLPQGLPQAYFFSNLCMIEVKKAIMSTRDFKDSISFFYVDDSVIYIGTEFNKDNVSFPNAIKEINKKVKEVIESVNTNGEFETMRKFLPEVAIDFQKKIKYEIRFYKDEKSDFCNIEDAGMSIAGLEPLMKRTSGANAIYNNNDEIEDLYSREKLEKIASLIDDEIKRLKNLIHQEQDGNGLISKSPEARLKLMKRYKRFYLYRLKLLDRRIEGEISKKDIDYFKDHFHIDDFCSKALSSEEKLNVIKKWFETFDEDIFQSETRMFISMLSQEDADSFKKNMIEFEEALTCDFSGNPGYLFYSRDFESSMKMKGLHVDPYHSISTLIRENYPPVSSLSSLKQKRALENLLSKITDLRENKKNDLQWLLADFTHFVFCNSDEFIRRILNAFYSIKNDIEPSEARSFTKRSSRCLSYTELRIMMRLRNKDFNMKDFKRAVEDIDAKELDNKMGIDMGLLEVLNIFISRVGNPDWVDNIILTHRVVKGLWYNGSKFMNSYTLHNEEHAVTLIKHIVSIVKAIDYLTIKRADYYILFLACYLHDISMVIHPNIRNFAKCADKSNTIITDFICEAHRILNAGKVSKKEESKDMEKKFKEAGNLLIDEFEKIYNYFADSIRNKHHIDSAKRIREWQDTVLKHLSPFLLENVATISESHGFDSAEVYGRSSQAKDSLTSMKYAMILIRLADLMDVANDRINYNLLRQNVSHMELTSKFHWISHLITDEIKLYPTFDTVGDEEKPIEKRKIIERLNFNLFLNVKYLEATEPKCKPGCMLAEKFDRNIVKLPEEYEDYEGLTLEMFRDNDLEEKELQHKCPMICKWIMKKHDWFTKELKVLNKYLMSVNDRWFDSEIRFNIIFRDEFELEKDLYDSVCEFINK